MKRLFLSLYVVLSWPSYASIDVHLHQQDTSQVTALLASAAGQAQHNTGAERQYIGQALQLAEQLAYHTGSLKSNLAMAAWLIRQQQRADALVYLKRALSLTRTLQKQAIEGKVLNELGNQSYRIGDYLAAESYYQQALIVKKKIHDAEGVMGLYTNLGMVYTRLTDYSRAFDALTLSNQLADSLHKNERLGGNYIDIASILALQKKPDESLLYYQKAVDIFSIEKDTIMMGYARLGIGETYMQQQKFKQAIDFFLSFEKSLAESHSQFTLYQNLGISFRSVQNFAQSEVYLQRAQQVNDRSIHNSFYTLKNNLERARLALQRGQYTQGIGLALKAEALARHQGVLMSDKECLEVLASLYEASGDLPVALRYQKQLGSIKDSIERINQSKQLAEAETRFRLGEKNREVEWLAKENELQKAREQFDQSIMVILIGSVIILLLAAGFMARAYKKTREKNALLAVQKAEIEHASQRIAEQSQQLREADKVKSRFFANISHELRTPVTLLTGMLEFMNEGITTQKEKERVAIALGNSRKLNTLVEEMLDLTRLESGKIVLKKKTVIIQSLLDRITGAFGSLLEKKKLRMMTDYLPSPIYAEVDVDKFEKIVNNLIYNAIKFTPAGGWIRVQTRLSHDTNWVEILISDSGSGIPQQDIPHIFDRFYQSESGAQKHDSHGTGIGLSLVKEFTVLHGGEVAVACQPGEGAVFTLRFPVTTVAHAGAAEECVDQQGTFTWHTFERPPSVLLVEDHEEMRAYVRELLGKSFEIAVASNGEEALQWLTTHTPDLIISDVMMPQMDGYTLLSKLKASPAWQPVPVIMLTARAAEEDKLHGLRLGVDDYLIKPFNATELRIRVQNLLLNQATRKQWLQKATQPEEDITPHEDSRVFMEEVIAYVEARIEDPLIGVGDLASHLMLSERQLYRKASELTGLPPAQLIKEIRLKKAYQLLTERKVNKVAELASCVGYESAAYFSKQFMERFGKRPVEYL